MTAPLTKLEFDLASQVSKYFDARGAQNIWPLTGQDIPKRYQIEVMEGADLPVATHTIVTKNDKSQWVRREIIGTGNYKAIFSDMVATAKKCKASVVASLVGVVVATIFLFVFKPVTIGIVLGICALTVRVTIPELNRVRRTIARLGDMLIVFAKETYGKYFFGDPTVTGYAFENDRVKLAEEVCKLFASPKGAWIYASEADPDAAIKTALVASGVILK